MWGSVREEDGRWGDGEVVVDDDDDDVGGDTDGETLDDSILSLLFLVARGALLVLGRWARRSSVMGGRSRPTEVYPVTTTEDPTPPPSPPPTRTPPPPPLLPSPPRCMLQEALDAALLAFLLLLLLLLLLPPPAVAAAAGPGILTCGRGSGR